MWLLAEFVFVYKYYEFCVAFLTRNGVCTVGAGARISWPAVSQTRFHLGLDSVWLFSHFLWTEFLGARGEGCQAQWPQASVRAARPAGFGNH